MVAKQFRGEVPSRAVRDRRMLARMTGSLVADFTDINRILQQGVECPAREGGPARLDPALGDAALGANAVAVELLFEQPHAAEFTVAREDMFNRCGFGRIYLELAIAHLIAQRHQPAHPETLTLGRGDLVADPLARHFALKLGERQQYVECQTAHRGRGVGTVG